MGSTRLPGKVLRLVGNLPLLGHVQGRLALSRHKITSIVATSSKPQDDAIEVYCKAVKIDCFRGNEQDVLDRYYQCAMQYAFKHIVRLTADNPFTDIEELDRLIELHLQQNNALTHSFTELPIGVGAEVFSFEALERSWLEGNASHHREHVDEYMLENPQIFKTGQLKIPVAKRSPELRLTVDTEEDWYRADSLVKKYRDEWLTTEQIISLCSESA